MTRIVALKADRLLESDAAIDWKAERCARVCIRMDRGHAEEYAAAHGLAPPRQPGEPGLARLRCKRWWRRGLRRQHWRRVEQRHRADGLVRKMGEPYISDHGVRRQRVRRSQAREFLGAMAALNTDTGAISDLASAAEHGLSNPVVRRCELLARIRGMEETYRQAGELRRAEFWTLTAPGRMHALSADGRHPVGYRGETPTDVRDYLQGVWSRVRAGLARRGIECAGLRIAEPHADGTPHYHFLILLPPSRATEAWALFAAHGLAVDPNAPGAQQHRVKREVIRAGESAVGYVIKYVSKAIDGEGVGLDFAGLDAVESAERVAAWASCWGVRQFQFFGAPAVGPWRELRRVDAVEGEIPDALVAVHEAAREGRYADYLGDPASVSLRTVLGDPEEGVYGDQVRSVVGVDLLGVAMRTRDNWEIMPRWALDQIFNGFGLAICPSTRGPGGEASRTRFNNCTQAEGIDSDRRNHHHRTAGQPDSGRACARAGPG